MQFGWPTSHVLQVSQLYIQHLLNSYSQVWLDHVSGRGAVQAAEEGYYFTTRSLKTRHWEAVGEQLRCKFPIYNKLKLKYKHEHTDQYNCTKNADAFV